ncbi:hypothetical protein CMI38_02715 [Candidatus Pacearchaeota archaeon]|jgi:hypothetical protein|nr:hypothetical protein [Candidatus Pacearchaeota archaeon]|tara:strand:- start:6971 stop:7225 length:255 start_codon:yes stop_codon:yes gene_type:complete
MKLNYKNFIAGKTGPKCNNPKISLDQLETVVNKWLSENQGIEVVQMTQSPTVNSTPNVPGEWSYEVMVSILYNLPEKSEPKPDY